MDQEKLAQLMQAQAALLTRLAASQDALERAVLSMACTHPDKRALMQSLESHFTPDVLPGEQNDAYEAHRGRLFAAMRAICSA